MAKRRGLPCACPPPHPLSASKARKWGLLHSVLQRQGEELLHWYSATQGGGGGRGGKI